MGCAALFCLPFVFFGGGMLLNGLRTGEWPFAAGGALFLLFAGAIMTAAWASLKKAAEVAAMRKRHQDEPWLWRKDWAASTIEESKGGIVFLWVFSILWLGMSGGMMLFLRPEIERGNFTVLIALLFPLVGLVVLGGVLYKTVQKRKYGMSLVRLTSVPVVPGRAFRGEINARMSELPPDGFKLHLKCLRRIVSGSGKNSSTREVLLWDEQRTVAAAAAGRSPDGIRLPFTFTIPESASSTDLLNMRDAIVWRLEVQGEVPGVDYSASFDVPVFHTAASPRFGES